MTNEKVKLFGWKTLTNKNSEVFKNLGEEQLQNPFVITWLLDCRNYDEKESSPHQFIKTIKNKNFLRYAKSDFIEFIIQKATTDFDLIELVLDLIDHCDILVIRGLLYSRAEVFKGLIYTKDALVSTSALRILDFCLVERYLKVQGAMKLANLLMSTHYYTPRWLTKGKRELKYLILIIYHRFW